MARVAISNFDLPNQPESARFKGLGEISPKEFAQFIGKVMRLSKVQYAPRAESTPIFNFYVGKNTPERKDYIMERLVVLAKEQSASRIHRHQLHHQLQD